MPPDAAPAIAATTITRASAALAIDRNVLVLLRRGVERSIVVNASLKRVDSVPSPQGGAGEEDDKNDEDDDIDP